MTDQVPDPACRFSKICRQPKIDLSHQRTKAITECWMIQTNQNYSYRHFDEARRKVRMIILCYFNQTRPLTVLELRNELHHRCHQERNVRSYFLEKRTRKIMRYEHHSTLARLWDFLAQMSIYSNVRYISTADISLANVIFL
jgi:deoxyribodipyrimidine photolyase